MLTHASLHKKIVSLQVNLESQSNDNNKKSDFALVGLHSCGNLSNSIVNLYLDNQSNESNKKCKLLFNVGKQWLFILVSIALAPKALNEKI